MQPNSILITRVVTDNEVILVAAGYTAIFLMLMLVFSTYLLAYKASNPKSLGLLSLVLFFGAVEVQVLHNAIVNWLFLAEHAIILPAWTQYRVAFLFFATVFVLYSAWRKNVPIKVVEISKDKLGEGTK